MTKKKQTKLRLGRLVNVTEKPFTKEEKKKMCDGGVNPDYFGRYAGTVVPVDEEADDDRPMGLQILCRRAA